MAITAEDIELIRLYLGDTDPANALVSDDQIELIFGVQTNHILAAAVLARHLAGKYSRSVSFSVEGLSISSSQKAEAYLKLADALEQQAVSGATLPGGASANLGAPFVGGVSLGEMDGVVADTDRNPSQFSVGMHDDKGLDDGTS